MIIDLSVGCIFISGVVTTKFCMKVGLWTIMAGKILGFSYHDNRCRGDQNTFFESNNGHFGIGWQVDGKRYPMISVTMEMLT